jgi:hypothetical protein
MSTVTLPNERTSRKGTIACANSTGCPPKRRPIEVLRGNSNSRLSEALPLPSAAAITKTNGNGTSHDLVHRNKIGG